MKIDVAVVGGGFAGLGAALTLGRARRSVVVIDAGHPRNAPAAHSHGYLTRDGVPPLELLAIGRREVADYGVEIVDGDVVALERQPKGGFRVAMSGGRSWRARRVLVTTGLVDELPDLPGLRERWGRDVVHCPFCFGWELRDAPLGVLATGPHSVAQALMWHQWSADLVLFLHTWGELTGDEEQQLAAWDIEVVRGEVASLEIVADRLRGVRLASGGMIERAALVVAPRFRARASLLEHLGVEIAEHPLGIGTQVRADSTGRAAPGVWVAGNVADVTAGVLQSAASGVTAAAALNADLTTDDTRVARAARTSATA